MDTDLFVYDIKTEDFYKDITEDVVTRFDTSGYEPDRPLPIGKNKKVIGLMKDELGGIVQRLKGGDYHLSGEFTGPTFSS